MLEVERSFLKPLPEMPYQIAVSHEAKLHPDCHLVFEHNHYSAPHHLRGKLLKVWATPTTVEIYDVLERVAFHARRSGTGKHSTESSHYPPAQRAYAESLPSTLREEGRRIGPETGEIITELLSGATPLRHLRRAQGIIRLEKRYGRDRLEKACRIARQLGRTSCPIYRRNS